MSDKHSVKKTPSGDWHRADIRAALTKAGWSLRALGRHHNYSSDTTLTTALNRPWPKGEKLICRAIRAGGEYPDVSPEDIWPSRYLDKPKSTESACVTLVKNARAN